MGLIKAGNTPVSAVPFSMMDIERQARAILVQARKHAEALLDAAQAEAGEIRRNAYKDGFEQGRQEGTTAGMQQGLQRGRQEATNAQLAQLTAAVAALINAAQELESSRLALESQAVEDVLRLSLAVAERLTKRQAVSDPQVAVANVREALKLVLHASDVRVAVHPSQIHAVAEALPEFRTKWASFSHIELVEDALLSPGGCRIYTSSGEVDGDLDVQLQRVVADLLPESETAA